MAVAAVSIGQPRRAVTEEPLPPRIQDRCDRTIPHQVWTHYRSMSTGEKIGTT